MTYGEFLQSKVATAASSGFEVADSEIHPLLKPHQRVSVQWAIRGGRRAWFEAFGLGKSVIQIETLRIISRKIGGRCLIVAPLGVRQEFKRDAAMLGYEIKFIRSINECDETGLYITNYETVRDGKIDPSHFTAVSLDEASVLRGMTSGTLTFRSLLRLFEDVKYRFVATATPDPNEFIELLAYSAYLGILDVSQAKTRWFKRDSTHADKLTLHPHKRDEFFLWLGTWSLFLQTPSDLGPGFSDEGYALPEMRVHFHEVKSNHEVAVSDKDGQMRMFRNAAFGVVDAAREKRESLPERIAEMKRIVEESPEDHFILWHDLEAERHAIEELNLPSYASVYGTQPLDDRETAIIDFSEGRLQYLGGKPEMIGSGTNLQRFCHRAIFLGIGFKAHDFIQAIHRIHRFLQAHPVEIHLIYSESEREVLKVLIDKWERHKEQVRKMSEIIRAYGLSELALAQALTRSIGVERVEVQGDRYRLMNNDCVEEASRLEENSVGLILTSIPFASQYEYTPSYNDFGHSESNEQFFKQLDYLTPHLLRVLQPGRIAAIHVKDRIVPGGINGYGFQSAYPFHADCIAHFTKHGFVYMGMKTIVTDVVRENNQTYRLGWSEQCKDATKMGYGMPEYLLVFRKPQSDRSKSYSDVPVIKSKQRYTRSRWQIDAHGFMRSSGNRPLMTEDLDGQPHEAIFKLFRKYSLTQVYDFEQHVALSESLERCSHCEHIHTGSRSCGAEGCNCTIQGGRLPVTFMLLQPQSWHQDVWTDITRMRTLNGSQEAKGKEMHLCPMQFDLADRVIEQMSNPDDLVYDPFSGLGTVPVRAIKLGRRAIGTELNARYFADSVEYCQAAEKEREMPTLFDLVEVVA